MDERQNLLARRDILRGYVIAIDHLPQVIEVVAAASGDDDEARQALTEMFGLSDVQADAILRLQILRFTPSQMARIRAELAQAEQQIADLPE